MVLACLKVMLIFNGISGQYGVLLTNYLMAFCQAHLLSSGAQVRFCGCLVQHNRTVVHLITGKGGSNSILLIEPRTFGHLILPT